MDEFINKQIIYLNSQEGDLDKKIYDCPICKNKGYIYFLEDDEIKVKICKCRKIRNAIQNMLSCGLDQVLLKKYTLDTYETKETWQKKVKKIAVDYIKDCETNNNWFLICGSTGEGKTHICTAIFKELISKNKTGRYIQFMNLHQLLNKYLNFMTFDNIENKAMQDKVNELISCDVLYIDDILKYCDDNLQKQLKSLYFILNSRYSNRKITIISSEYNKQMLKEMDESIYGRIFEMANKGKYIVSLKESEERNIRLRNDE